MASKRFALVNKKSCVACGACKKECPREAINIWKGCFAQIDELICIGCGKCERICPAEAISFKEREKQHEM